MKPTTRLVRAIAAEFARRTFEPLLVVGAVAVVLLTALGIFLVAAVSAWWWFLLAPVLLLSWVFTVLATAIMLIIRFVDSVQSAEQKQAVAEYTTMLERTTETIRTPYMLILAQIARDVVRPRQNGFIATVSRDSMHLAPDFKRLITLFSQDY